ncbi:MAG: hypothetical protein KDK51_10160, partial [Deltaproteobacteria bacterium]|nr:hypothetical protein [Deltaproteobacteria bacterium]
RAFLRGCFDVPVNKVQAGLQPQQIGKTKIFATTSSSPLYPDQDRTLTLWHMLYQQMLETSSVPTP